MDVIGLLVVAGALAALLAMLAAGYVTGLCSRRGQDEHRNRLRVSLSQARTVAFVGLGLAVAWSNAAVIEQGHHTTERIRNALVDGCERSNDVRGIIRAILQDSGSRPRPGTTPEEARIRAAIIAGYVNRVVPVDCSRVNDPVVSSHATP